LTIRFTTLELTMSLYSIGPVAFHKHQCL